VELVGPGLKVLDALDLGLLARADQRRLELAAVADQVVLGQRVEVGEEQAVALADRDGRRGVVHAGRVGALFRGLRRRRAERRDDERARDPHPCAHGIEVHPCFLPLERLRASSSLLGQPAKPHGRLHIAPAGGPLALA
jgi:hypothetical protein